MKILHKKETIFNTTVWSGFLYLKFDSDNNLVGSNLTPRQLLELKKYITADQHQ